MSTSLARVLWIFMAAGTLLCFAALFFGVSLNDEAFYVALAYRFALGDRPFVDDSSIAQSAAFVLIPLFKTFLWIRGDSSGLMLFSRMLYFGFTLGCAFAIGVTLQTFLRRPVAWLIAMMAVFFLPWQIPGISYNTLSSLTFAVGCVLAIPGSPTRARMFGAGVCHALSILGNPTYVLPVAVFGVLVGLTVSTARWTRVWLYVAGGSCLTLVASPWLWPMARDNFSFVRQSSALAANREPLWLTARWLFGSKPHHWLFLLAGIALGVFVQLRLVAASLISLAIVVIIALFDFDFSANASTRLVSYVALSAPIFLACRGDVGERSRYLAGAWLASASAATAISSTSANGVLNSGLGFFAGAVIAMIALAELSESAFLATSDRRYSWSTPAVLVLLATFLVGNRIVSYMDGPVHTLRARVAAGPYQGLWTTTERKHFLEELQDMMDGLDATARVAFFEHLPAGYLSSSMRPLPARLWTTVERKDVEDALAQFPGTKAFVVRVYLPIDETRRQANGPDTTDLDRYVESHFRLIRQSRHLALYTTS